MTPNDARIINAALKATRPAGLVGYHLCREDDLYMEPIGAMYDYVIAGNGLYLSAQREELTVVFPIASPEIRGLVPAGPLFDFDLPHVPENLVQEILETSFAYAESGLETLFWLRHSALNPYNNGWLLEQPEQDRRYGSCRPHDGQDELYEKVIIEIHSHHGMRARFSQTDDKDETGFRIYGVIGNLPDEPQIRMRVGVYGAGFWEIPATWALELPAELADCVPDPEEMDGD